MDLEFSPPASPAYYSSPVQPGSSNVASNITIPDLPIQRALAASSPPRVTKYPNFWEMDMSCLDGFDFKDKVVEIRQKILDIRRELRLMAPTVEKLRKGIICEYFFYFYFGNFNGFFFF